MNVIETVKVSSRGQIVIPENIREDVGIEEGTKLVMIEENGTITLKKEEQFLKELKWQKEKTGWLALAEKSMEKIWDNKKDDETWNKY